jgi:hypothetical protein
MRFSVKNTSKEITLDNIKEITNYSLQEIYKLMGVYGGDWGHKVPTVHVSKYPFLDISVETELFAICRQFRFDTGVVTNVYFGLGEGIEKGTGIGRTVFKRQVEFLAQEGFVKIKVDATGNPSNKDFFNGFITWGLLGFTMNEEYHLTFQKRVKARGIKVEDLFDLLINIKDGREYWEDVGGFDWRGEFLLQFGSVNLQNLEVYLESRNYPNL